MATLESDEANIVDAEAPNWRLVVYPVLFILIVGFGALGYYYYLQNQREQSEADARAALVKATTPEEFLKVAEQYPHTDQATLAVLQAANASFAKRDYAAAVADYRKVTENATLDPVLHDSATLGLASALEGSGSLDKAIAAYNEVADRGDKSPYAPFACFALRQIYEGKNDKDNDLRILKEAAGLDPDSWFTKQALLKLKQIAAAAQPPAPVPPPPATTGTIPAPASGPASPAPVPPKPVAPAK